MRIHHLALPQEWEAAQAAGEYQRSTRGLSLAEVGFVHCARPEQVEGVRDLFYSDVESVVLLTIETDRLTSPWQFDPVPGAEQTFPHVYGPINLDAVVETRVQGSTHDSEA